MCVQTLACVKPMLPPDVGKVNGVRKTTLPSSPNPCQLSCIPHLLTTMNIIKRGIGIASDPKQMRWICPLLLVADAALCALVVWKIPCASGRVEKLPTMRQDYIKLFSTAC